MTLTVPAVNAVYQQRINNAAGQFQLAQLPPPSAPKIEPTQSSSAQQQQGNVAIGVVRSQGHRSTATPK